MDQVLYNRIKINEDPEVSYFRRKIICFKIFLDKFFFLKGAEIEDLEHCSQLLVKSMIIREKYMVLSQQSFPFTTAKYLNKVFSEDQNRRTSIRSHDLTEEDFLEQNQKNDGKSLLIFSKFYPYQSPKKMKKKIPSVIYYLIYKINFIK
jgi:hypothetical protein